MEAIIPWEVSGKNPTASPANCVVGLDHYITTVMEEILHQLIGSLSHYLQGFIHPRWCRISSINSMTKMRGWFFSRFSRNFLFLDIGDISGNIWGVVEDDW